MDGSTARPSFQHAENDPEFDRDRQSGVNPQAGADYCAALVLVSLLKFRLSQEPESSRGSRPLEASSE